MDLYYKHKGEMTICREINCKKRANYNMEGEERALFCGDHKENDMLCVVVKNRCIENLCNTKASFNVFGEKPMYCNVHKTDIMVNVSCKTCIETGCSIRASFNVLGEKPLFCAIHKTDTMTNLTSKKCIENGCYITASFNKTGEKIPLFCGVHKKDDMINIMVRKCIVDGCQNTSPKYNIEGHKTGPYCKTHKTEIMVDVVSKRCKTHLCGIIIGNNKYEGYCLRCFVHTFPDKPVSRNYKTKERATVETVLEKFQDMTWTCDKTIQDGCSFRRPDVKCDMGSHIVIIEIDEYKHAEYECSCENKRIMEISQDVGHRPIVFIRFNPDGYTDVNDKKITSCWSLNKLGIMTIKNNKQKEWIERIILLHRQIQYWIDNVPEKMIETIQLFY